MAKSLVDQIRDGAQSLEIGGDIDKEPLRFMFGIGTQLHVVKDHAIYRVISPDDIDPERTNPAIPPSHTKVLAKGLASETLGRTLFQANELLGQNLYRDDFPAKDLIGDFFEVALVLCSLEDDLEGFRNDVAKGSELVASYGGQRFRRETIPPLPSIPYLEERLKAFFHRAQNVVVRFERIVERAFPAFAIQRSYSRKDRLFEAFIKWANSNQVGSQTVAKLEHFADAIHAIFCIRNAFEHPDNLKRVICRDFRMNSEAKFVLPEVDIQHPSFKNNMSGPALNLLEGTFSVLVKLTEAFAVALAWDGLHSDAPVAGIKPFPDEFRRYPFTACRFYMIFADGTDFPLG